MGKQAAALGGGRAELLSPMGGGFDRLQYGDDPHCGVGRRPRWLGQECNAGLLGEAILRDRDNVALA